MANISSDGGKGWKPITQPNLNQTEVARRESVNAEAWKHYIENPDYNSITGSMWNYELPQANKEEQTGVTIQDLIAGGGGVNSAQMAYNATEAAKDRAFQQSSADKAMAWEAGQAELNRAFQQSSADKAMAWQDAQNQIMREYNTTSAKDAMNWSSQEAQVNRNWQEEQSNTSYQRAVRDMKKAGLNPILSALNGGAVTGAGAQGMGYQSQQGGTGSGSSASGSSASGKSAGGSRANGIMADTTASLLSAMANMATSEASKVTAGANQYNAQTQRYNLENLSGTTRAAMLQAEAAKQNADTNRATSIFGLFSNLLSTIVGGSIMGGTPQYFNNSSDIKNILEAARK